MPDDRWARVCRLMTALSLGVAGCGGGGGNGTAVPPPAPTPVPIPVPAPTPVPVPAPGPDTQPPLATLTAPADRAAGLAGTLTLDATASDDVGVAAVEFQLDGAALGAALTSPPFRTAVDTAFYASGQHVARVRARDAAGNVSPWSSATLSFGGARTQPGGFTRNESWITGLSGATALAQAPDGRFFVTQQGGALRIAKAGALLAAPFLQLAVDSAGERGLLGVALHPAFATNGFVYVYYTSLEGGAHNRVSRFTAAGDVALAGSEVRLMDLPPLSSATNHNGGALHFGADGTLYIGVGDNANGAQAQDLSSVFGKLLRIGDDGGIPVDNPFQAGRSGLARAVWAYGLRNPYTFAVQPGSGTIFVNDVGNVTWEEIDRGSAGANYGWPGSEGPDNLGAGIVAPLFSYRHAAAAPPGSGPGGFFTGFAIAGGTFYPDAGPFPVEYRGQYFFADYVNRFVARFDAANGAAYAFGSVTGTPVDLATGADGALYVLTRDSIVRFGVP